LPINLLKELPKGVDPLGPDNKLIFAAGPLTVLNYPDARGNCVGAKSPLTNTIAKAEAGEFWGSELKFAGFDAVIVEGKADKPVYLSIIDGQAAIKMLSIYGVKTLKRPRRLFGSRSAQPHTGIFLIRPDNLLGLFSVFTP